MLLVLLLLGVGGKGLLAILAAGVIGRSSLNGLSLGEDGLLRVDVPEGDVEDDGEDTASNGGATEDPGEIGIGNNRRAGKTDDIGHSRGEQVDGRDETSHVDRSARVSNTVSRHVDEQLGNTTNGEGDGQEPNADVSDTGADIAVTGTVVAARRQLVGVVVEHGISYTADGGHGQTGGDASDGTVVDVEPSKRGVQAVVKEGSSGNDTERVEVGNDVVGDTIRPQHGRQEISGGTETVVVEVLDREEAEDTSTLECTADILNELVAPLNLVGTLKAGSSNVGRLGQFPETVTTDLLETTAAEADTENPENVGEIGATGRVEDEALAEEPQEKGKRKIEDERDDEGEPPANVLFGVGSGNTHKTTNVDDEVEPQHDTLSGGLGVLDNALAGLEHLDHGLGVGNLIEEKGRDVGLEHACNELVFFSEWFKGAYSPEPRARM